MRAVSDALDTPLKVEMFGYIIALNRPELKLQIEDKQAGRTNFIRHSP
jgi:hypothetical protein